MSSPNALLLLADHIKLSLLERQRAKALKLNSDSQDGHISRSLDQFREGLEALVQDLEQTPDESKSSTVASLQKQYHDLTSQFHGFASPAITSTLTHPNDPSLAADFAHAQSSSSSSVPPPPITKDGPPLNPKPTPSTTTPKTVRFTDTPDLEAQLPPLPSESPHPLFPYRDLPDEGPTYRDTLSDPSISNTQIHQYHARILSEQDAQLDALGESISRQRELSMQIGDELDSHVLMLDETERATDRHQGGLDRARRQVGRLARGASECNQMTIIVVLIIILVLLIVVLK
ncbi:hypothetical protein B0T19DRAFT_267779 [Cercophora scortea]|uniref:t-SNARE coiled-coil homology domain-containing protein n=1 Tax=Cercophora scortea TaxID=314031 RepID=A0AAE0M7J5_9PEZI|nr:hypothetical protein B0T19DRAFT_267779 [Cercophora scortea]